MVRYEVGDKSRLAGAWHEYHCLDYCETSSVLAPIRHEADCEEVRHAILCTEDTTLDHAEIVFDENGRDRKSGSIGAN
jgi:hypothetical protein